MPADGKRSRHRAPAASSRSSRSTRARTQDDGDVPQDHELDSYLAALAPEPSEGVTESTGRFGTAQVFQLRLPPLRVEQLRRLAAERGVSPGALALDWVVERLDREDMPTGPLERVVDEPKGRRRASFRRRKQ
ncbi:MAG: hypothetical protein J0I34_28395 [Pseudonocardia sp.]|uniref:hypothetical protein n=1 Tax=unclassified Pseudonocardia TaxID=2619320 RepID=UPI00086F49EF|nr:MULTISPECIES: hypothetical protein [unclassified Pseudonocardia]MBN9112696.1 hypothetical protein [Pseudonocardia sp.]ODU09116.1 MAG: hypothetical protein ABS80_23710 [Pseudonocardia sp. SCN 72-51]ODV00115.1 MAG: hypothetical protein ABT15_30365 [Pseudonocardia sp. SCN 73-27]